MLHATPFHRIGFGAACVGNVCVFMEVPIGVNTMNYSLTIFLAGHF